MSYIHLQLCAYIYIVGVVSNLGEKMETCYDRYCTVHMMSDLDTPSILHK